MSELFVRSKQEWRVHLKKSAEAFFSQKQNGQKSQAEAQLQNNLIDYLSARTGLWGGYQALPQEPNIALAVEKLKNLEWVFSRVNSDQGSGQHLRWFKVGEMGFELGSFAIQEPVISGAQEIPQQKIQGFLIPGLGFDRKGNRLGWGKGFYDRTLADFRGLKIGVAFSSQVVTSLPSEAHDVKMDLVITEKEVIKINSGS